MWRAVRPVIVHLGVGNLRLRLAFLQGKLEALSGG
jgi:hypothetical protein